MLRAGVPKRLNALTLLGGFGCFSSTVSESGCPGRRGAAANSLEISGDCGPAERASGSGAGEGEFIEIQFAETHRDYKFEAANDFSIFRRNAILKNAARSGRAHAARIDVVLQGNRNSVQRAGAAHRKRRLPAEPILRSA
jgi:hypothetical protein